MKTLEQLAREAGFSVEDDGAINDGIEISADFTSRLVSFRALCMEEAEEVFALAESVALWHAGDGDECGLVAWTLLGKIAAIREASKQ